MAGDCRNPELCCNCKSEDHHARYCRYSWHHSSPPSSGHNSPPNQTANKWKLTLTPLPGQTNNNQCLVTAPPPDQPSNNNPPKP